MKLETFQVHHCFGFYDSGKVDLCEEKYNLIYLLGRNSSGKSSFLTALRNLDRSMTPQNYKHFWNFNRKEEQPALLAEFSVTPKDLTIDFFINDLRAMLEESSEIDNAVKRDATYQQKIETIFSKLHPIYEELIHQIVTAKKVWVKKTHSGDYVFASDESFTDVGSRAEIVNHILEEVFPNYQINVGGSMRPMGFRFQHIEAVLFRRFPRIILFKETYPLLESLPGYITRESLNSVEQKPLLKTFLAFLGVENVTRLLHADSRHERRYLLDKLQEKVTSLNEQVNRNPLLQDGSELVHMFLDYKEGLQVTVEAGGKESFYSHISDNTKLLFAYYLYQSVYSFKGNVLLFDEPNEGFHASAQVQILTFLRELGEKGSLVVASTHSEYLIDPEHLSGVRLMGMDDKGYLIVRNRYHTAPSVKHQGDYLALQPIEDAIGLKYGVHKLSIRDKVIVMEGITDMLYLRAFNMMLYGEEPLYIVPTKGESSILHVVPLLISQGMRFKIVMDTNKHKGNILTRLKEDYDIGPPFIYQVPVSAAFGTDKGSGIEDLFSKADFKKLIEKIFGAPVTADFDTMSNSEYIKQHRASSTAQSGPKWIDANWFYNHIKDYQESDFELETRNNFRTVLKFCKDEKTWFSI